MPVHWVNWTIQYIVLYALALRACDICVVDSKTTSTSLAFADAYFKLGIKHQVRSRRMGQLWCSNDHRSDVEWG